MRNPSNACGEVTSCTRCKSMYSREGLPGDSRTTCSSQIFSNRVRGDGAGRETVLSTSDGVVGMSCLRRINERALHEPAHFTRRDQLPAPASVEVGRAIARVEHLANGQLDGRC